MALKQIDLMKNFQYTEKERALMLRLLIIFKDLPIPWDDPDKTYINTLKVVDMLYQKLRDTDKNITFSVFEETLTNVLIFCHEHIQTKTKLITAANDDYNERVVCSLMQMTWLMKLQIPEHGIISIPQSCIEYAPCDKEKDEEGRKGSTRGPASGETQRKIIKSKSMAAPKPIFRIVSGQAGMDTPTTRGPYQPRLGNRAQPLPKAILAAKTKPGISQPQAGSSGKAKRLRPVSLSTLQEPKRVKKVQSTQGESDVTKQYDDVPFRVALFVPKFKGEIGVCLGILIHQNTWYDVRRWMLYEAKTVDGDNCGISLTLGVPPDEAEKVVRRKRLISFLQDSLYIYFFPWSQTLPLESVGTDDDTKPIVAQMDPILQDIKRPKEEMTEGATGMANNPGVIGRGGPRTLAWIRLVVM